MVKVCAFFSLSHFGPPSTSHMINVDLLLILVNDYLHYYHNSSNVYTYNHHHPRPAFSPMVHPHTTTTLSIRSQRELYHIDNASSTATRHNMTTTTTPSMLAPIRMEAGQVGPFESRSSVCFSNNSTSNFF